MYGIFEDQFWWQSKGDPHEAISKFIEVLRDEQDGFYSDMATFSSLYNGRPSSAVAGGTAEFYTRMKQPRLTFNIIHSLCQAATAKIAKHRPGIMFLTEGGNFTQQSKAKAFNKLVQGQFHSMRVYSAAQSAFLDACITGTGVLKVYPQWGEPTVERIRSDELTIDPYEVKNGNKPRQLFQTKLVSRHVMAEMYPEKKAEIADAQMTRDDGISTDERYSDMIECYEAWHLPSGPEATDGRHVICIKDVTLLDEEYEKDYFPFAFIRWTEDPQSFWGNGLTKEVKGIQVEINKLLVQIQEQMHLATPKVFIEEGSKISQASLNNRIWGAIKYRGTPPQFFVPRAVSGEMFAHLDRLVERAYEMTGISQLAAQSKKPVGLESGRALREFSDIESERFMVVGQAYEQLFMDIAEKVIDIIRDLHFSDKPFKSMSFDRGTGIEQISWADVSLKEDQYVMQIKPIGSLPQTPAAKLASVTEMHMNGMFTKDEAHDLLDFPDLSRATKMKTAHMDIIDKVIDSMIEDGDWIPPEPYMNIEFGLARVQQAYNLAMIEEVPEERIELLRRWMAQADSMLQQSQPAAPQPPMPSVAGPGAGAPSGLPPIPMGPPGPPMMPPGMPPMGGLPPGLPPGGPPLPVLPESVAPPAGAALPPGILPPM